MAFRLLIADDHNDLRNALKTILETRDGWQVCALAADGREAVEKASESAPDAVVLDFVMPVMDGIRAAREILQVAPSIPIVLYTNHVSSVLELEAKKAGIRQVVSKNGAVDYLLDVLAVLANERTEVPAVSFEGTESALPAKSAKQGGRT